jgi:PAS domain S-box-containing protein
MEQSAIRILLIDDNPGDVRLVNESLALAGAKMFNLSWAPDLTAGLAHLADNDTDTILLDLGLPDSSGLSTFEKVHASAPQTPIILLTGVGDEVLAMKSVQSGAQDYLAKSEIGGRHLSRMILYAIERERAMEALRKSEAQLANAAVIARLGPWEYDVEKDVFTFNDLFYALFKTTAAAVGGYSMSSAEYAERFVHPEDRDLVGIETQKAVDTDDPNFNRQVDHRVIYPDGTIGYISVQFFIVKDSKGKTVKTYGVNQDINGRKRAEEILRESEARYRELFENINSGVAVYEVVGDGQDFIFKEFNRAGERIDHDKRERLIGKSVLEARPGVEKIGLLDVLRKVWRTGEPAYHPVSLYQDEHLTGWYENYIYKLPSGEIVAVFENVTERMQVEEALRESEERYRVLFEGTSLGILAADIETKQFVDANPSVCRMLGYSAAELMELRISDIHPAEALDRILSDMQAMIQEGPAISSAAPCLRKDGTVFYADISGAVTTINGRKCLVGFFTDVTGRQQAEKELAQSHEQLRALTAYWQNAVEGERTRIARQLHDDFGQSMTALKMDLTWLAKRLPKNDEKAERLHGMNALIDDSITLMQRTATDLRPNLLDDLGLNAALEWQAQEFSKRSGIPVHLNLPKVDLDLDPGLSTALFRIFQEVVTNVIRHARAKRVDTSLELMGKNLILTIHDNGRGISESELKAPRSLGLLGLRERAAQWGGETSISGVAGEGTTVTVRIPLPATPAHGGRQ